MIPLNTGVHVEKALQHAEFAKQVHMYLNSVSLHQPYVDADMHRKC